MIATVSTVLPGGKVIATPSTVLPGGLRFDVGLEPPATKPPEARGLACHDVRLLVASDDGIEHMRFRALPRVLHAGDLLVINTSATLPAAMFGERIGTGAASVHFSTELDDGAWLVEVRPPVNATGPVDDAIAGERIRFGDGAVLTLRAPYPSGVASPRLWYATLAGARVRDMLRRFGRPIAYAYIEGVWPLSAY
ncbi:MAG: S-adenosylmethionine:tRNA ribosyltransferase-isomerase, partial [Longimicrobiales bacterium]